MASDVCAMQGQHGCSGDATQLCEQCERLVCDLHAVNTYGSYHLCIGCYTWAVASGAILPELWDADAAESERSAGDGG